MKRRTWRMMAAGVAGVLTLGVGGFTAGAQGGPKPVTPTGLHKPVTPPELNTPKEDGFLPAGKAKRLPPVKGDTRKSPVFRNGQFYWFTVTAVRDLVSTAEGDVEVITIGSQAEMDAQLAQLPPIDPTQRQMPTEAEQKAVEKEQARLDKEALTAPGTPGAPPSADALIPATPTVP